MLIDPFTSPSRSHLGLFRKFVMGYIRGGSIRKDSSQVQAASIISAITKEVDERPKVLSATKVYWTGMRVSVNECLVISPEGFALMGGTVRAWHNGVELVIAVHRSTSVR